MEKLKAYGPPPMMNISFEEFEKREILKKAVDTLTNFVIGDPSKMIIISTTPKKFGEGPPRPYVYHDPWKFDFH